MGFYVDRVLVPYQRADALLHGRPRGNLSDLYPRWLGARELLLHHRNPYSREITREIQVGYYGRELDATRPSDPKDQQGFAYPVYVALFLAPTVGFPFERVTIAFEWLLVILTAASVPLWLRVAGWRPQLSVLLIALILTLGSFPAVQGFKLQQLTLVVAALIAASSALLVSGHLFAGGALLAVATIKPQLALPIVLCLLLWTASDWQRRQRFFWGFGVVMVVLLGGAELLLPGWFGNFLSAAQDYRRYAGGLSMLDVLLSPLWGRVATAVAIAAVGAVCWRFRTRECDSPVFRLMVALILTVTVIVIPMFAPYNYLLVLPAVLLVVRDWGFLWSMGSVSRTGLLLAAGAIGWPWVAALGLAAASLILSPAAVQRAWWLPLYSSVKIPIPLACLVPLSFLVARAWREAGRPVELKVSRAG
jgi:Glycosyltransferase family 87